MEKKKLFIPVFLVIMLIGLLVFVFAETDSLTSDDLEENEEEPLFCTQDAKLCSDGSYVSRDPNNNCEFFECPEDEEPVLGASCGTVAPGYQNECCIRKGYEGWDEENWRCIGEEDSQERPNKVGTPYAYKNRELTETQIQNIIQARNRITIKNDMQNECPEACICSGSTVKCSFENGTRVMTVYAGNSGNVIVQVKNVNASTNVTLYKEDGKMYGVFRNNETREIILPDEALEKLKQRNEKRLQLYNESINLTEEGYYQIQTKKKSRLFLLIPVKEQVRAQVDAETGEVIKLRNPWWGFLARDIKEK